MNFRRIYGLLLCSLSALSLNATTINLGNATSYSVLAGSTVTNTGATVLSGDLGVSPGSAITGFPPGFVNGTQHAADANALAAQNDALTAYNSLAGFTPTLNLTGQDLGGLTLTPGVYRFDSSAQLTGALTLNLQGNLDSLFIFRSKARSRRRATPLSSRLTAQIAATFFGRSAAPQLSVQALTSGGIFSRSRASR
jgi:hypothetical protein